MQLDTDVFDLHLALQRRERGLDLAIRAFDPKLHPRGVHGKFAKKLSEFGRLSLPTPVMAEQHDGGFRVHVGTGRNRITTQHKTAASAARTAIAAHNDYTAREVFVPEVKDKKLRKVLDSLGYGTPMKALYKDKDGFVDVGSDVTAAADLLATGHKVRMDQPRHASTLLAELHDRVQEAKRLGKDAPTYDLCKVTVKNTNLFCSESKGIPRVHMPQLSGVPTKGSKADKLPKDDKGGVNLTPLFRQHLEDQNISIENTTQKASYLRASQIELNGAKVAGMTQVLEKGDKLGGDPRLFVSHDDYIVDGHHRWAANVGADVADNKLGDIDMDVARVDMGIIELLDEANRFAAEWGIPQAAVGQMVTGAG
jgi:hypothetical protein